MRRGKVICNEISAGIIEETADGYRFQYIADYVAANGPAISLTLPLQVEPFESTTLFPFFHGLLAEGNLKDLQCRLKRIDPNDHFARLLETTSFDVIGNVRVERVEE